MTIAEAKQELIDLAQSQVRYQEGPNNYNKYADDPKVIQLYGWCPQNQPWCCTFVNWCYLNAFGYDIGSRLTYGGTAACSNSAQLFMNNGAYVHMPEVGNQAFFYSGGGINHTGIVVKVDGSLFTTVEGNYSDKVSLVQHNIGDSDVAGFGRPCWNIIEGSGSIPDDLCQLAMTDPEPDTDQPMNSGTYVVQKGDSLWGIAQKLWGNGAEYPKLVSYNNLTRLNIYPGQVLKTSETPISGVEEETPVELSPEPEMNPDRGLNLPNLMTGLKGTEVYLLQSALTLRGFSCGKLDGDFGPVTAAAVNRFKQNRLLPTDGKVDAQTWIDLLSLSTT